MGDIDVSRRLVLITAGFLSINIKAIEHLNVASLIFLINLDQIDSLEDVSRAIQVLSSLDGYLHSQV